PVRLMPQSTRILPAELKKAWAMMVLATRANKTRRMAFEWRKRSTRSTQLSFTRVRAMVPAVLLWSDMLLVLHWGRPGTTTAQAPIPGRRGRRVSAYGRSCQQIRPQPTQRLWWPLQRPGARAADAPARRPGPPVASRARRCAVRDTRAGRACSWRGQL